MTKKTKTTWRKVKLGEIGKIVTGKTPSTKESKNFGGPFPFVTIPDLKNQRYVFKTERTISEIGTQKMRNLRLPINSVIMSCLATVGETGITTKESFTNQQINSVICNPKIIDYKFLYYTFRRLKRRLLKYGGSVYVNVSKSKFSDLEIEIPSLNDQKRIASILSAFDDKIELNNKISRTLEQMAQVIFKEWFIKFKFPGYEKVKMIDSELEKIPEGWEVGKISDLISVVSGYSFSSKLYGLSKKSLGVVTIRNVQDGNFVKTCDSFITKEDLPGKFNPDCFLKDGDILLSLTGNVGRVCFVYGGEYLLNQRVAKLKSKNPKDFAFCYFLFRQKTMQNYLINMAKGSAQPNLSPVETGKIKLAIAPRKILDKFSEIANPIYQRLIKNTIENQKLAALRDLLLPKLMNGEIKV